MENEIKNFINSFNNSWTSGQLEVLSKLIHEHAVFIAPDLSTRIKGKSHCLQTMKEYIQQSKTKDFELIEFTTDRWGDTATVSINYEITYELNGQVFSECGKEFWTLIKQTDQWLIVWRAMVQNENISEK